MRRMIVSLVVILALVNACSVIKHSVNRGASSSEVLSKLGPPTRVNQSVGGVEVWEYEEQDLINAGTFYYYIKDGKVIRTDLKTRD